MQKTLIIGYGNRDRADDGVAFHVINGVRHRLGCEPLSDYNTGLDDLPTDAQADTVFMLQLAPELLETIVNYDQLIFVDAHVREDIPELNCERVIAEYAPSAFTHHTTPAMLFALLNALYHKEPVGYLVSIRGYDFDFHRELSEATAALVELAIDQIMEKVEN